MVSGRRFWQSRYVQVQATKDNAKQTAEYSKIQQHSNNQQHHQQQQQLRQRQLQPQHSNSNSNLHLPICAYIHTDTRNIHTDGRTDGQTDRHAPRYTDACIHADMHGHLSVCTRVSVHHMANMLFHAHIYIPSPTVTHYKPGRRY